MKLKIIPIGVLLSFGFFQCANENTETQKQTVEFSNKIRENKKVIKSIKEFQLSSSDSIEGVLTKEQYFNENGGLIKSIEYSLEKKIEDPISEKLFSYNDEGKPVGMVERHHEIGEMRTSFDYVDGIKTEENFYENGKLIYTDVFEYNYNDQKQPIETKVTRTFNGKSSVHKVYNYLYHDNNLLAEERKLRVKDMSCCDEHRTFAYDEYGNIREVKYFVDEEYIDMTVLIYNEYGEKIKDSINTGAAGYWTVYTHELDEFGSLIKTKKSYSYDGTMGYRYAVEYY